jgi:hypothetical protein
MIFHERISYYFVRKFFLYKILLLLRSFFLQEIYIVISIFVRSKEVMFFIMINFKRLFFSGLVFFCTANTTKYKTFWQLKVNYSTLRSVISIEGQLQHVQLRIVLIIKCQLWHVMISSDNTLKGNFANKFLFFYFFPDV